MDFPQPSPEALHHSNHLKQVLIDRIQSNGAITFYDYMNACLYEPGLGYYVAGSHKFGESGDFITAPELTPLFGEVLANQYSEFAKQSGQPFIFEFGAGSGKLAFDILQSLKTQNNLPKTYFILEVSPDLRDRQKALLKAFNNVVWLNELPKQFSGFVIANEVIDAMPVHRVQFNKSLKEYYVNVENNAFVWQTGQLSFDDDALHAVPQKQYTTEINTLQKPWLNSVYTMCDEVAILLIDYGYTRQEYFHPERSMGTLMCHYQHRAHGDPFLYPGLQDMTAMVNFSALADAAYDIGFDVAGFTTQAAFLLNAGLLSIEAPTEKDKQAIKRLTAPNEMGERFKVLWLEKNLESDLSGFQAFDQLGRL